MKGIEGKTAIVTGGASGMGAAVSERLVALGAKVAIVDVNEDGGSQLQRSLGASTLFVRADVGSESDVDRYLSKTKSAFGGVDLFFNNAGMLGASASLIDSDPAEFDRLWHVNTKGAYLGLRAVLRAMRDQGRGGAIVNTSSLAGLKGYGEMACYAAVKHAVIALSRSAAIEAGGFGVRVNAICPGPIDTPMQRQAEAQADAGLRASRMARVPLGRFGEPDDIADVVTWLLSDEAGFVSGAVLTVDGGLAA